MAFPCFASLFHKLSSRWPLLLYAATWTVLLTVIVAVASLAPEAAFVAAISPSSGFARECRTEGAIRVPLDLPGEVLCFPAQLFSRSKIDLVVPPVFAAAVVAGSAWVVRALSLWQFDQAH